MAKPKKQQNKRNHRNNVPHGVIFVDKPAELTSHDVVDRVRRATGVRTVGHAGTLDPIATGLLIVLVGRAATKEQQSYMKLSKEYMVTMELGRVSDTYDADGKCKVSADQEMIKQIDRRVFDRVLSKYMGIVPQTPPPFSAIHVHGVKAYKLARKGERVELQPRNIQIFEIKVIDFQIPFITLIIKCSTGTYIRSLVHAIGKELATGAIMTALRRTAIGPYRVESAQTLDALDTPTV